MPFPITFPSSALDGSNGFRINGEAENDGSGRAVGNAGDVNGDGFGDIVIGAPFASPNGPLSGSGFVVFGTSAGFDAQFDLSALDGSNGFRIDGAAAYDFIGQLVGTAGDVNGDGIDDIVVGALASNYGESAGYVIFGSSNGFAARITVSDLDGSNGFRIEGESIDDEAGSAIGGAGDVNGDGIDDVIVGAYRADPNGDRSGASYVLFGTSAGFAATFALSAIDGSNGFRINGAEASDYSGFSVSAAGDVNGDGIGDVIVGATGADPGGGDSGASYVVFGRSTGFAAALELSALDGGTGFRINGEAGGDKSGVSVSAAGDINGDGIDDLIVGANAANSGADSGLNDAGASYVVFGRSTGFAAGLDLSGLDGANGFRIAGESMNDYSGTSVAAAGDVNGDGIDDVIVGAHGAGLQDPSPGASYILFGRSNGFAAKIDLFALTGSNGFRIDGEEGSFSGISVSGAGDVNGDGVDDIIVGAYRAGTNAPRAGASYVVFGIASPPPPPPTPPPPSSSGNSAPVAGDDAFTLPWQTKLTAPGPGLLGNDTDFDGDPLTVTGILSGPAHGVVTWNADGGFIYQPNAAYVGPDGFTYQVGDGRGGFDTAQVLITVADDEKPDPVWPIEGGFGNERLAGSNQADTIRGHDGDDTITGDGGRDRLEGNVGDDSILGQGDEDIAWGGHGNDVLDGGQGNDWVLGDRGDDTVQGGAGHDFVWGGQGDDRVFGDGGHDMLSGDRGRDTLTGGEGADRFVFREGGGLDLVTDFTPAEGDRIVIDTGGDGVLNGLALGSFADLLARMVDTPDGVFLSLGDPDHSVTIAGITKAQLTGTEFLFL